MPLHLIIFSKINSHTKYKQEKNREQKLPSYNNLRNTKIVI